MVSSRKIGLEHGSERIIFPAVLVVLLTLTAYGIWGSAGLGIRFGYFLFLGLLYFIMLRGGRTYKTRSLLFILIAFMSMVFIWSWTYEKYPDEWTIEDVAKDGFHVCYIGIPQTGLSLILDRAIIYPSGRIFVITVLSIWAVTMMVIGMGFCSWTCPLGGSTELFTKFLGKPLLDYPRISKKTRYLPYATLISVVILSWVFTFPVFCAFGCPYRVFYPDFAETTVLVKLMRMSYSLIALIFVIGLPIITKRRTFCAILCPLGALNSIVGRISPYRMRVDREKCVSCRKCIRECPMLAITDKDLESGVFSSRCDMCGKCVDECPQQAIGHSLGDFQKNLTNLTPRGLFIFSALFLAGITTVDFLYSGMNMIFG